MIVERPGIVIVGTAHVSKASVEEVRETIAKHDPDVVAVELDPPRLAAVTDRKRFEETPVTELIKGGKSFFVIAQAVLSNYQRRMGEKQGVEPGAEMKVAIDEARARNKELVLADRDIGITLKRAWTHMGFREKTRLTWEFLKGIVAPPKEDEDEVDVDKMLEEDTLTLMMSELKETAPGVAHVLIHERDQYLAHNIREASKKGKVVAVVGAGHVKGILHHLDNPHEIPDPKTLEHIPKKRVSVGAIVNVLFWSILALAVGVGIWYGVTTGDWWTLAQFLGLVVLAGGLLTAVGALLGGAHPLSILAAFPAAPIGTLHPAIAAGWIVGFIEAKLRPPTVKDFQTLSEMQTFGDMWRNRLMRVLLVTAFANIGNMVANLVVIPYLAIRFLGTGPLF